MSKENRKKPWGGRFKESTDKSVEDFTASIGFDKRLYRYDIEGSVAHAKMLAKQKIITNKERDSIIYGLAKILSDIESGSFTFKNEDEDIHMAIENALIERVGEPGAKLHTARSRNDQVALDIRLYLRDEIKTIIDLVDSFKSCLLDKAISELDTIMPGYTHLQKAQPVLLSHYLLAYLEMLDRDKERLLDCYKRVNVMPLGVAALAGTSLPIDRRYVARLLKFSSISKNSIDTVADRDFVAEFNFCASVIMMHLSRFCEDLIIWSTDEFNFIEISDAFTTGSSLMPQKKNPDVAELIRGKTGRVFGNLFAILTVMKGLPMAYNRDMQEDKEALFDTVDTVKSCLGVFIKMMASIKFNKKKMIEGASAGFSLATDIAEYLVSKSIPFRKAHGIVGRIVSYCLDKRKDIKELTLDEFQMFEKKIKEDIFARLNIEISVNAKKSYGGTSRDEVLQRINEIRKNK